MNLLPFRIYIIFFLGNTLFLNAFGQGNWTLKKEKEGITVYTRETSNSAFDEFRANIRLNQSIHSFIAVMRDVESLPDWAYSVKKAKLLKESGDTLQIYYSEASVPFPFNNRDGIYMNNFLWKNDSSLLLVTVDIIPGYVEEKANIVRIPYGNGFWRVKVVGENLLDITFQLQVDPGGELPSWLANMFVTETPLQTLLKLREVIRKDKYQNRKFDFLE
jgi:hypothetical protein